MIIIPEREIAGLVSPADCLIAVERVFASMANKSAYNFPVVREAIGHAEALYGFKSGFDREKLLLGLKSGGFWPNNVQHGLSNHQSTIFLFDAD
ncbi:MAG: ornithine cyclodeaminase family protein, partial [Mesorhizobium sp.]